MCEFALEFVILCIVTSATFLVINVTMAADLGEGAVFLSYEWNLLDSSKVCVC
jgi:hypothetical protein